MGQNSFADFPHWSPGSVDTLIYTSSFEDQPQYVVSILKGRAASPPKASQPTDSPHFFIVTSMRS
jgi:hypothetical protein